MPPRIVVLTPILAALRGFCHFSGHPADGFGSYRRQEVFDPARLRRTPPLVVLMFTFAPPPFIVPFSRRRRSKSLPCSSLAMSRPSTRTPPLTHRAAIVALLSDGRNSSTPPLTVSISIESVVSSGEDSSNSTPPLTADASIRPGVMLAPFTPPLVVLA